MRAFERGELDVLVATTVIEVGVDVPNATAMVILDADRFGLSQLHQLRGRVGRGAAPGVCLLVTDDAGRPRPPASGWTRWPAPPTGSSWPASTWSCAGRATCWAPCSPGAAPGCGCCRLLRHEEIIAKAQRVRDRAGGRRPRPAPGTRGLAELVGETVGDEERAAYLDKV